MAIIDNFRRDYAKARSKADGWGCSAWVVNWVALRFAVFGDSGRFRPRRGFAVYRITRHAREE